MASDDFSRAVARAVAGQLAELAGYEAVQESASDVLAELLIKYITELSATAHGYAELANRTGINIHDALLSLDDLGTSVSDLQAYLKELTPEANTFQHVLPDYPIRRPGRTMPSWLDKGEEPPPHIPAFLPAFPDKHTYKHTPTFPGHVMNPDKQAQVLQKGRKQAESSLLNLHHATMAAGKQAASAAAAGPAGASAAGVTSGNPFLAPPEVTVVALPHGAPRGGSADASGAAIQGTGAYEPHAASKAFAAVVASAEGTEGGGADGAGPDGVKREADADLGMGIDDLMSPQELNWRYQARLDEKGALKQPLGTSTDYASVAFTAAHTYALGTADPDAFEEAAKGEATAASGGMQRKRKSTYGTVIDPIKRKAQEVLDRAKDPNVAAEGDE